MASQDPPVYELLTSTRFDRKLASLSWNNDNNESTPFLILPYHYERLAEAARHHGWTQTIANFPSYSFFKSEAYEAVNKASDPSADAYKVRFTLSQSGTLSVSATPTVPLLTDPTAATFFRPGHDHPKAHGTLFDVRIDTEPTPASKFTSTKTTHRKHYDAARARVGLPSFSDSSPDSPSEVIIFNTDRSVTEGSYTNVAFWDPQSACWYTPRSSTGCLPGVLRRWLLEQRRIRETNTDADFRLEDLKDGTLVLLINSVLGCRVGKIQRSEKKKDKTEIDSQTGGRVCS